MSGVIDGNGQQWEHCGICHEFVKFPQNLGYVKPTKKNPYGMDICVKCVDKEIRARRIAFRNVVPAPSWQTVKIDAD